MFKPLNHNKCMWLIVFLLGHIPSCQGPQPGYTKDDTSTTTDSTSADYLQGTDDTDNSLDTFFFDSDSSLVEQNTVAFLLTNNRPHPIYVEMTGTKIKELECDYDNEPAETDCYWGDNPYFATCSSEDYGESCCYDYNVDNDYTPEFILPIETGESKVIYTWDGSITTVSSNFCSECKCKSAEVRPQSIKYQGAFTVYDEYECLNMECMPYSNDDPDGFLYASGTGADWTQQFEIEVPFPDTEFFIEFE